MPDEMSQSEQAAWAAMQQQTGGPESQPSTEPASDEAVPSESEAEQPQEAETEPAEAESEDDQQQRRSRTVPVAALQEERTRRQQLEADNRRLAEERARFDERLRVIQEMYAPQQQPQPEPDEQVDPIGTITHLRERLARLEQGNQQYSAERQAQVQVEQLAAAAGQDVQAFKNKIPDYMEAFNYWATNRAAELQSFGVPPQQLDAVLRQEQLQIAANAFQRGVSPAQTLYQVARARGFKPGNGSISEGQDNPAAEQVERIATGQQRNQTLSGTGGGSALSAMTAQRLANMSMDEFAEWTAKNPRRTDQLLGKPAKRGR